MSRRAWNADPLRDHVREQLAAVGRKRLSGASDARRLRLEEEQSPGDRWLADAARLGVDVAPITAATIDDVAGSDADAWLADAQQAGVDVSSLSIRGT